MDRGKVLTMHWAKIRRALARMVPFVIVLTVGIVLAAQLGWAQWSTVNGEGNQRYSSLTEIDAQNVAKLGAAWVWDKFEPMPSSRATPVVDGGLMFLTAPPSVYAVNVNTGKIAWRYQASPGASPARGGVAVGDGLVFVGLSNTTLIALRGDTGELVWEASLADPSGELAGFP
jgi:quinohemoprotein ethanol dehydrogenase